MDRNNKFKLIAVSISVLSSKSIPLIVGVFLVSKLSAEDFNSWTYLIYLALVFSAAVNNKLNTDFARKYTGKNNTIIPFYFNKYDLHYIVLLFLFIGFLFFKKGLFLGIIFSGISALLPTYNYFSQYLRFAKKYSFLIFFGVFRVALFLPILFFGQISLNKIVLFYFLSVLTPIFFVLFKFKLEIVKGDLNNDTIFLFVYGFLMALSSNIEKFILEWVDYDGFIYANLNYMLFLVSLVTIVNEVTKKVLLPEMYLELNTAGVISKKMLNLRRRSLGILFVISVMVPYIFYIGLFKLGLTPSWFELSSPSLFLLLSMSYGVSLAYSYYNVIYFKFKKVKVLIGVQVIYILIFIVAMMFEDSLSVIVIFKALSLVWLGVSLQARDAVTKYLY